MRTNYNAMRVFYVLTLAASFAVAQVYDSESQKAPEYPGQALPMVARMIANSKLISPQQILRNSFLNNGIDRDTVMDLMSRVEQLRAGALDVNVSETCLQRTEHYLSGIMSRQPWALQMFDATTKIPSGILDGKFLWLGSFDQCTRVNAHVQYNETKADNTTVLATDQFDGQYCLASLKGNLPLHLGVCLPEGCNEQDAKGLVNTLLSVLRIPAGVSQAKCQNTDLRWTSDAIAALCVAGALVLLVVIATIYDMLQQYLDSDDSQTTVLSVPYGGQNVTANGNVGDHSLRVEGYSPLLNDVANAYVKKTEHTGTLKKVILAFSVYTNAAKVLNTKQGSGALTCVNGIRFLSLSWVIWGHTYAFIYADVGNLIPMFTDYHSRWTMMVLWSGTFSVDSFFVMSGLLVTYLTLREMKKGTGIFRINWGLYYFHRFWRLTPPYMLILFVYSTTFKYWSSGPGWPEQVEPYCNETWWTNLLYINNVVETDKMCMGWSWYLANDMQFFVISPLILFPLFWKGFIGFGILLTVLLGSFITTGVVSNVNHLGPLSQFDATKGGDYMHKLYFVPWIRIGPYLIGMITGYLLYYTECKPKLNRFTATIGWILATGTALATVYGLHGPIKSQVPMDNDVSAFYSTVARTVWGACVAWVIYACCTGYGGFVNTLMSWSAFVPLGRLTYCAYLVHPAIMYLVYYSRETLVHVTDLNMTYFYFGHLVMAYGCAFIASMVFEAPMMGLEKAILNRDKSA